MGNNSNTFWTDEKVSLLKKLFNDGETDEKIFSKIKAPSRNSVTGKRHRLGLISEFQLNKTKKLKTYPKRNKKYGNMKTKDVPYGVTLTVIPILRTKKHIRLKLPEDFQITMNCECKKIISPPDIPNKYRCKWIYGDVKGKTAIWCNLPTVHSSSWCSKHYKEAFQERVKGR